MKPIVHIHSGDFVTWTDKDGTWAMSAAINGRASRPTGLQALWDAILRRAKPPDGPSAVYIPPQESWNASVPEPLRGLHEIVSADLRAAGLDVVEAPAARVWAFVYDGGLRRELP